MALAPIGPCCFVDHMVMVVYAAVSPLHSFVVAAGAASVVVGVQHFRAHGETAAAAVAAAAVVSFWRTDSG